MKDIALIVAHTVNEALTEKYFRLKEAFSAYGDVIILLHKEEEQDMNMPENIPCVTFDIDQLNTLEYEPICETLVPGSNHFALLWFYLSHPRYRYYWNIEYDVEFTGDWNNLFEAFRSVEADFISTHIQRFQDNPNWYWWGSYQGATLDIPLKERIRSFNPIYRISHKALAFLDSFLKAGNSGHHEVLVPSVLFHSGFKLVDFGGRGKFTLPHYEDRFYYMTSDTPGAYIEGGTMRHQPPFVDITGYHLENKLFHPVK